MVDFSIGRYVGICVLLSACGGQAPQSRTAAQAEREAANNRVTQLTRARDRHQQRVRELEARLAMSQAEARDLRQAVVGSDGVPRQTVVLGEGEENWNEPGGREPVVEAPEPTPADDGRARPVLRLYGTPTAGPIGELNGSGSSSATTLPPLNIPPAPAGMPTRLAVSPLPGSDSVRNPVDVAPVPVPQRPITGSRQAPTGGTDAAVQEYQRALTLVRDRRFEEALSALERFVRSHRAHPYAANATYWRGEVHYARREYRSALRQFERVVSTFPNASKVPDSLLKIGLCHRRMGNERRALSTFAQLRQRFPGSVAARLASQEDAS